MAALAVAVLAGVASAAVYEVGDKAGWTVMGNPNYAAWASSKKFRVNDVVGASRSPSLPVSVSGELAHEHPVSVLSPDFVFPSHRCNCACTVQARPHGSSIISLSSSESRCHLHQNRTECVSSPLSLLSSSGLAS